MAIGLGDAGVAAARFVDTSVLVVTPPGSEVSRTAAPRLDGHGRARRLPTLTLPLALPLALTLTLTLPQPLTLTPTLTLT